MGSAITTVGARAGKPLYAFTAADQDSGVVLSTCKVVGKPTTGDLPPGYKSVLFQLTGTVTAGGVTVYGTIDLSTAQGNGAEWVPVIAPSTEASFQWSNPLSKQVGQSALYCGAPFVAYRAVSSDDFAGNAELLVMAAP